MGRHDSKLFATGQNQCLGSLDLQKARVLMPPASRFLEVDVQGLRRNSVLHHPESKCERVEACKEMLARSKEHGTYGQVDLVDEPGLQILANDADASADADIRPIGRLACTIQCSVNSFRDEMEGRTALHHDRIARMVG